MACSKCHACKNSWHRCDCCCERKRRPRIQRHVHEFLGTTELAEENEDRHDHRFAGITDEAILINDGHHIHRIEAKTDFFGHYHRIVVRTSIEIPVGEGKHIHFVEGTSSFVDGHDHDFQFATLIEDPTSLVI